MILTVTLNPAVDHTLAVDHAPQRDAVNRATWGGQFDAGGKGINVSQYLDALGVGTVTTGLLGGFTGRFIERTLAETGLETAFGDLAEPTRMNTTVLAADGEYKFNEPGPTATTADVEGLLDRIREFAPDRVAVAGSLPPGLTATAIDRLAGGEWATSVDVGGDLLTDLTGSYETCKPNREELSAAVGRDVETVEEAVTASRALLAEGYERVVTSLGAEGAVLVTDDVALYAPAIETDVVDTVGAGDSLFAGVLAALDRGASEADALATGVALAGAVVATAGTSPPAVAVDSLGEDVAVHEV